MTKYSKQTRSLTPFNFYDLGNKSITKGTIKTNFPIFHDRLEKAYIAILAGLLPRKTRLYNVKIRTNITEKTMPASIKLLNNGVNTPARK